MEQKVQALEPKQQFNLSTWRVLQGPRLESQHLPARSRLGPVSFGSCHRPKEPPQERAPGPGAFALLEQCLQAEGSARARASFSKRSHGTASILQGFSVGSTVPCPRRASASSLKSPGGTEPCTGGCKQGPNVRLVPCSTQITPDKEETDCRRGSMQLSAPNSHDRSAGLCCSGSPSSGDRDGLVSGCRELALPGTQQIPPRWPGGLPAFSSLVLAVHRTLSLQPAFSCVRLTQTIPAYFVRLIPPVYSLWLS